MDGKTHPIVAISWRSNDNSCNSPI